MNRHLLIGLGLCLMLIGCPERSPPPTTSASPAQPKVASAPLPSQVASSAALAAEAPCTLDTQLVPGIPGSPGHLIPSAINPNGNSELAEHMRTMQSELKLARAAIERGEKVAPLGPRFRKIRCAWPTNQSDRNAAFDASAQSYLQAVAALDAAPPVDAAKAYGRVLDGCRACHEQSCGGAIPAIEALRMTAPDKK